METFHRLRHVVLVSMGQCFVLTGVILEGGPKGRSMLSLRFILIELDIEYISVVREGTLRGFRFSSEPFHYTKCARYQVKNTVSILTQTVYLLNLCTPPPPRNCKKTTWRGSCCKCHTNSMLATTSQSSWTPALSSV